MVPTVIRLIIHQRNAYKRRIIIPPEFSRSRCRYPSTASACRTSYRYVSKRGAMTHTLRGKLAAMKNPLPRFIAVLIGVLSLTSVGARAAETGEKYTFVLV